MRHALAVLHVAQAEMPGDGPRAGTIFATEHELTKAFGPPQDPGADDEKVKRAWYFDTPRGRCALRDYWWNIEGEWSVGAWDQRVCVWLRAYLETKLGRRVWRVTSKDAEDHFRDLVAHGKLPIAGGDSAPTGA